MFNENENNNGFFDGNNAEKKPLTNNHSKNSANQPIIISAEQSSTNNSTAYSDNFSQNSYQADTSYPKYSSSNYDTISPDSINFGQNKKVSSSGGNNTFLTKKFGVTLVIICIIGSFLFGIGGGIIGSTINKSSGNLNLQTAVSQSSGEESNVQYTGQAMNTSDIAAFAADSVVEISTESVQRGSFMQQYVVKGAGSGVIVSDNGYIVTNNHVIDGSRNITVRLKNGTSYSATLVGTDSDSDIALLKIDATSLKAVVIGDSSALKVGDVAVAIGNPLGELGGTVTSGIISALDRTVTIDSKSMSVLQTDSSINPGNSGGGLFNHKGEFIGLVVAKSRGDSVEGLGFAIPSNNVQPVLTDLKDHGYVTGKPQLGVNLVDVTSAAKAKQYGVSQIGVYVSSVEQGSAAAEAGLAGGDCITSIDGIAVSSSSEVQQIVKSHNVSDNIAITVLRNGQTLNLSATLKESTNKSTTSSSVSSMSSRSGGTSSGNSSSIEDWFYNYFGY